jgi:hypothetical protein
LLPQILRAVRIVLPWVIIVLDDLCEVALALGTGEAVFIAVPLVLTLVAVHYIPFSGLIIRVHDGYVWVSGGDGLRYDGVAAPNGRITDSFW